MEKYIDRDKVLEYRETVITDDYSGNETLDVVLTEEILGLTPANVVEREKIDKAIDEIEEERYMHYTNVSDVIDSVLEILKRNIGEWLYEW